MFSRLGFNRSPQHQQQHHEAQQEPINFKRKVLLPATVFNKVEKDRSVSRQPRHDKSLTPTSRKLQVSIQPSKSRGLLFTQKSNDQSWLGKSNLKKHLCENCNSFMGNMEQNEPIKHHNLKEQMRTVRDLGKRNEINELFETITEKAKEIDQKKDQYQIQEMRVIENFKREKQKINDFYAKVSNIITKHREGTLVVMEKRQEEIVGELQSRMKGISQKMMSLSSLEEKVCSVIPGVQKLTEESFNHALGSIRNQYSQLMSNFKAPTFNFKPITVKTGDQKYLSTQLVDVIEHFLSINNLATNKGDQRENIPPHISMPINSLQEINSSINLSRGQVTREQNCLQKYISIVDGSESESDCEMLLSKRL